MEASSLTVLLIELPGFATHSAQSSSKELNVLLKEVYEISDSTMRLHQGLIFNFSGDNFLVIFNSAKTGSATAFYAIEAINEFKERLNAWFKDKKFSSDFSFKAGIALGEAIVEEFGTTDKKHVTVMGEALGFATRLREFAEDGQVLVNEDVFEAAKNQYNFQKLEPLPIRGSKKSLPVFELKDKKRAKLSPETFSERRIASEMVGRNAEVEALESCIKKLIAGKGSVVNIIGKAGIGKSRLVEEMKAQAFMHKVRLLEGRALSMGKSLSFHPITHIIKSWAGISEEDPPAVSSEKLQASIMRGAKDQADEIFPFIATMMGLPLQGKAKDRVAGIEGEALEKLILKNLRDLITAATTIMPVIIMIEDMHWADSSSISFLESLYKLASKNRVMFINVLRPGYEETGDYILKYLDETIPDDYKNITIEALVERESKELIGNLLQKASLPAKVNEIIIRKTEGNPFFIEEVIRSFIDDGIIETKGKEFRITEKIAEANIPETINEVILSRVDKLDEKTKDLLKTASVIGRNFYYKVLEEAADTIGELDDRLEYLKEVQLIGESKKKEEIEYLFKHALAQQATYESILMGTKKELHTKIARSIEKVFSENIHEFYGTLAYHYEKAENMEKTEEYLVKAGDSALQSGAPNIAKDYWEKGLNIYQREHQNKTEQEKLANYYYNLSLACHVGGLNLEAIDYIEKFQAFYITLPPQSKFRVAFGMFWRFALMNFALSFPQFYFKKSATELDDKLMKLAIVKGESMVTVYPKRVVVELIFFMNHLIKWNLSKTLYGEELFLGIATSFVWTGISHSLGKKVIDIYERIIDQSKKAVWTKLRYMKIQYSLFSGTFYPDTDTEENEVQSFGANAGLVFDTAAYLIFSSYIHIENGDWDRSRSLNDKLLQIYEDFENIHAKVQYYRMTGIAYWKFRKLNHIVDLSTEGFKIVEETGHLAILMLLQCIKASVLALTNKIDDAQILLKKAEKIAVEKKRGVIFYSTFLVTKCYVEKIQIEQLMKIKKLQGNDCKSFRKTSREAVKYSKMYAGNLIEAYRLRAIAFCFSGNNRKALKYFKKSIEFGEKSGGKLELSRTYFELGKFLSDPKTKQKQLNGLAEKDYLEKAKTLFEEMELQWDLQEYHKYVDEQSI